MQRVGTPTFPNLLALRMGAPALLIHGSEWQRKRFLPKIFSCEEIWCQGYSEPNAGSDVANQQTFAEKKGDNWVINGHKVWTSFAHFSNWMQLLCRTDHSHKYKGLSYFLVPMDENLGKTIEVRPLIKMTGEAGFNEVFLNDVVIPDKYRVDDVGMGWTVAMTLLQFERSAGAMVEPAGGSPPPNRDTSSIDPDETPIIVLAKKAMRNGKPAADDPVIRDRMMALLIRKTGFEQSNRRAKVKGLVDHPMRLPMQVKLVDTEIGQDIAALGVEIEGAASTFSKADKSASGRGRWPEEYMSSFGLTISAGSSEIQHNQLGERVLGMPKSK
jgi:alkylation response protein AidB-like acyl-CoA dehydrogenase